MQVQSSNSFIFNSRMKRFLVALFKFSLPAVIPLTILLIFYIATDPFKVIRSYDDYSYPTVIPNTDYISTEMFVKNYPKYHYNSFIFGSSRTIAFNTDSWEKHLPGHNSPYIFNASGETVWGIYKKVKYLDSSNVKIDNALIILCRDVSFKTEGNSDGHLFIKHPLTSNEGKFTFYYTFFNAFISPKFLFNFIAYKAIGKYKPFMKGYIQQNKVRYDTVDNQIHRISEELEMKNTPDKYYAERSKLFYARVGEKSDPKPIISPRHIFMLKEIKRILDKQRSTYKIVISPLYEQVKFNSNDLHSLKGIFGDNLYDFSGKNYFTDSQRNFYENSHYRPTVGDSVLNMIYNGNEYINFEKSKLAYSK